MCYSAMVKQDLKYLAFKYNARIQLDMFLELFEDRLKGNAAKISRTMESYFLEHAKSPVEKKIVKAITEYRSQELSGFEKELFVQKKRFNDAERKLKTKATMKAQSDLRISTDKIEKLKNKIEWAKSPKIAETDQRIYPGMHAPLVFEHKGDRVIAPFRYLLRPKGESPIFDKKFNGAYNMRRDSLDRVFWWKNLYGKHHGFMEITSFWENVERKGQNEVIKFTPEGNYDLTVPCIFDFNSEGEFPLQSFALITDDPNPEVKAAGHDRTPVFMKQDHIELWLSTERKDKSRYLPVFGDKQPTYFEHEVAA